MHIYIGCCWLILYSCKGPGPGGASGSKVGGIENILSVREWASKKY